MIEDSSNENKSEKALSDFRSEIKLLIQKKETENFEGMFELQSVVPEELTLKDAIMWKKLKNYPSVKITKEEIQEYKEEVKKSKNNARYNFSCIIFQKLTPTILNEAHEEYIKGLEKIYKPIRACILDRTNIDDDTLDKLFYIEKEGQEINLFGEKEELKKEKIKSDGEMSYVISECNEKNKFSKFFVDCTSVIAVGEDKKLNKQISFLSHQDPGEFLEKKKEEFIDDLSKSLLDIKEKSKDGSIDIVIVGGDRGGTSYKNSIKLLNKIIKMKLGFSPTVLIGPNLRTEYFFPGCEMDIYLDTQKRGLYIVRFPHDTKANKNYTPDEILKIKKEEW